MAKESGSGSLPNRNRRSEAFSTSEGDFATAYDVYPMRVPLETVQIGKWKYVSKEMEDIELLYELQSSNLVISVNIRGSGDGVPASFYIHSISAVDLSLVSIVPGSLESMVASLVLETDREIKCRVKHPTTASVGQEEKDLDIQLVKMTASVHESGHLRDILLFLKCNYSKEMHSDLDSNSSYMRPKSLSRSFSSEELQGEAPRLTFVEKLPYWASYIPWTLYSMRTRKRLQLFILMYSIFTVLWAMWQLYRHVNIIRILVGPLIEMLKFYLSSVVETFDWVFNVFTHLWHTYLSPLNILRTILFAPVFNLLLQLKTVFSPLTGAIFNLLQNTGLLSIFTVTYSVMGTLLYTLGSVFFSTLSFLLRPLSFVWQYIINSRCMMASMDFQRIQLSWIFSLVLNSIRSIVRGLLNLVGYGLREVKIKKAKSTGPTLSTGTPTRHQNRRNMPHIYSSPVTKQD